MLVFVITLKDRLAEILACASFLVGLLFNPPFFNESSYIDEAGKTLPPASESLLEISADPRHLGAQIGLLAVDPEEVSVCSADGRVCG